MLKVDLHLTTHNLSHHHKNGLKLAANMLNSHLFSVIFSAVSCVLFVLFTSVKWEQGASLSPTGGPLSPGHLTVRAPHWPLAPHQTSPGPRAPVNSPGRLPRLLLDPMLCFKKLLPATEIKGFWITLPRGRGANCQEPTLMTAVCNNMVNLL